MHLKLKLKDRGDDTYVLSLDEDGKQRGVFVVLDMRSHGGSPVRMTHALVNGALTLASLSAIHFIDKDGKVEFVENVTA